MCSPRRKSKYAQLRIGFSHPKLISHVDWGFIGASFATEMWHLLLSQAWLSVLAWVFVLLVLLAWYHNGSKRRRSACQYAISTSGTGFGGLVYALATDAMLRNIGLAWAFPRTCHRLLSSSTGPAAY